MSEARAELRLDRLEADVAEIKATLASLVPLIHRIDERSEQFATKVELANLRTELLTALADKPGKGYLWLMVGTLIVAYAAGLAGLAALPRLVQ